MSKPKVAIVSGGYTGEYEVSLKTGKTITQHLQSLDKYELYNIIIDRNNWIMQHQGRDYPVDKNDFTVQLGEDKLHFDIAFLTIHGTPSEDGKLQGYLEMMQIPYCMCGVLSSAITFNKKMANEHLMHSGVTKVAQNLMIKRGDTWSTSSILSVLSFPLFVKPNEGGSSLATYKVYNEEELEKAIYQGLEFGKQVLIEEYIEGREFSVGVYESEEGLQALPITELITENDFFDYEAKYTSGKTQEVTPADIPEDIKLKIQKQAVRIFEIFQCSYFVRIDFIWKKDTQDIYFLEVNTMPGQSEASILPQQIRCAGMSLSQFYDKMLSLALHNGDKKS